MTRLVSTIRRRAALVEQAQRFYGVKLYPHPTRLTVVLVSEFDYKTIMATIAVMFVPPAPAAMETLGGEFKVWRVPDWVCSPRTIALLRLRVLLVDRPLKPIVRAVDRLLGRWL